MFESMPAAVAEEHVTRCSMHFPRVATRGKSTEHRVTCSLRPRRGEAAYACASQTRCPVPIRSVPMDIKGLGWRTDVALLEISGSVLEDRGDHLVVITPDNPTFWWGNFVLLAAPPADAADARQW